MKEYEFDRESDLSTEAEQALASVLAAPELNDEELAALRGRIAQTAALPLARRRAAHRPRSRVMWLRPLLPLAAAALLVLVLNRRDGTEAPPAAELSAAERALLADVSDAEFAQLVSGAGQAEALLLMAVTE